MIPHSRPTIDKKEEEAVTEVLKTGYIAEGLKVEEFESVMASYIGVKEAAALSSGTAALHLSLLSLGIKKEDEVIIPNYTCLALLNAVYYVGAKPRLVDIDRKTYNIDPNIVDDYLKKKGKKTKTKAIILVHTFGQPVDIEAFLDISKRYNIPIIEDAAQALGATFRGKRVCSFGDISVISFYATKVITTGEGGMILSNRKDLIEKVRDMREYDKKDIFRLRYNYKMTDMAAAMGLSQLKKLPSFIKIRERIAMLYDSALKRDGRRQTTDNRHLKRIFYRYVLETRHPDRLIRLMEKEGISCRRPIFRPLHHFVGLGIGARGFPNSELAWERAVSIPIYPSLTTEEIQKIVNSLAKFKEMFE